MKSADGRFEYFGAGGEPLPQGSDSLLVCRFYFQCRSVASRKCSVAVRPHGSPHPGSGQQSWQLSGTLDAPTLAPSINCSSDECWHGYIEDGVFKTCGKLSEAKQ